MKSEEFKRLKKKVEEKLTEHFPKKISEEWLEKVLDNSKNIHLEALENSIIKPVWELVGRGGKRLRPIFMYLIYKAVGGTDEELIENLMMIPELIHNGTLIIDDIEDESLLRRGKPCIHHIFGESISINAGNSLYYIPCMFIKNYMLDEKIKLKIYETILEEMTRLSFGQAMDIYWHRKNIYNVSEEQYFMMCSYKTGSLLRMAAKIAAIAANKNKDVIEAVSSFAESIGIAFQIQDDILNITNKVGKEFGEDIKEGKITLIIIRTLEKAEEKDKDVLTKILSEHTKEKEKIRKAIEIIEKYDGIEYAKEKAKNIVQRNWKEISQMFFESKEKELLEELAFFVINREI